MVSAPRTHCVGVRVSVADTHAATQRDLPQNGVPLDVVAIRLDDGLDGFSRRGGIGVDQEQTFDSRLPAGDRPLAVRPFTPSALRKPPRRSQSRMLWGVNRVAHFLGELH